MSHVAELPSTADAPAAAPTGPVPGRQAPELAPAAPPEMRPGLDGDEVRRRLARAARHEETSRRVLAFYLVEMDVRRLYQTTGHGSTAHYAEARLGLDRRRVAELLRVGAKLLELREVDRAFCEGRLGWAKVLDRRANGRARARSGLARTRARARRPRARAARGAIAGRRRAAGAGRREGPARDPIPRERLGQLARIREARAGAAPPRGGGRARGRRRGAARRAARPVPRDAGRRQRAGPGARRRLGLPHSTGGDRRARRPAVRGDRGRADARRRRWPGRRRRGVGGPALRRGRAESPRRRTARSRTERSRGRRPRPSRARRQDAAAHASERPASRRASLPLVSLALVAHGAPRGIPDARRSDARRTTSSRSARAATGSCTRGCS